MSLLCIRASLLIVSFSGCGLDGAITESALVLLEALTEYLATPEPVAEPL